MIIIHTHTHTHLIFTHLKCTHQKYVQICKYTAYLAFWPDFKYAKYVSRHLGIPHTMRLRVSVRNWLVSVDVCSMRILALNLYADTDS